MPMSAEQRAAVGRRIKAYWATRREAKFRATENLQGMASTLSRLRGEAVDLAHRIAVIEEAITICKEGH